MADSRRIERLQKKLHSLPVDGLLITDPIDLYYFTGLSLSKGALLVTSYKNRLIVDGRYFEAAKKRKGAFEVLLQTDGCIQQLYSRRLRRIGFDSAKAAVSSFISWKGEASILRKERDVALRLIPLERPYDDIRAIKDKTEIKKIKDACELCVDGVKHLANQIREGVTEKELASSLELFWLRQGADALSFPPIVAFSKSSSLPHYRAQNVKLKKGDLILVDVGVSLDGYHSDMTRMFSLGMKNEQLRKICSIVREAGERAMSKVAPGVRVKDLDSSARSYISECGYGEYFIHSLGHGIGLEVHEWPFLREKSLRKDLLQEGMCITIEPGIYLPNIGGARIEDTILVTKEGHQVLTNYTRELIEV